ncbi:MAG: N-acetyl-gamma-glutamyl-phosphate reductase, partial [Trebonia sp.]
MGIRVAVAGASGYAGGELLRLLAGHPDLKIAAVSAGSSAGKPITSIHPNLTGHPAFDGKDFAATTAEALADAELVFMALPHGESAALAAQLPDVRIVDLSADFRLDDEAAWHQFYGDVRYAGRWAYGLPEMPSAPGEPSAREKIKAARTVAAPGCYATTSIIALAPLLHAGLVEPDDIVIVAASGTSGAGRSLRHDLLASEVIGSMSAYKVGGTHRHTPE